jgi:hypothetical protein
MDTKNMTAEERKALMAELQQQEAEEKAKKEAAIETYKSLVDETVKNAFPRLIGISEKLAKNKAEIRALFQKAIDLKASVYEVSDLQKSHTFTDKDSQFRVTVGVYTVDNYDDTVDVGIKLVRDYVSSLAKDKDSSLLVDTILKLLAKDNKGTLKASRVLQLQQMAAKTGDEKFLEGMKIIRDAYRPIESKTYIRAEYKDEKGEWINVPLGLTEA